MSDYKKILVALDVYATYEPVIQRAFNLADKPTDVSLIHVSLTHVYFEPYGAAFETNFVENIQVKANRKLNDIAKHYKISDSQIHNAIGNPADEIHKVAEKIKADLIVVGTHGRSGLKLLLGSTANAVLHGVKCDVLAVKI